MLRKLTLFFSRLFGPLPDDEKQRQIDNLNASRTDGWLEKYDR